MIGKWRIAFKGGRGSPAPELPLDLLGPGFLADPYPAYAWLRENAPIAEVKTGGYLLTRAADIHEAFTDPRLGNAPSRFSALAEKNSDRHVAAAVAANIPPFLDKPRHVGIRRILSAAFFETYERFDLASASHLRPRLEALAKGGEFELISEFARPYASSAMAAFIGLPDDAAAIARASDALFMLFAPITDRQAFDAVNEALSEARAAMMAGISAARQCPGDTLLSRLIAYQDQLSDMEIADNALLVLADGIENIEAAIALVLIVLDMAPDSLSQLRAGGEAAEAIVEEALRLQTPAQLIPRVTTTPHERHGVQLGEGTPVFLALGSANRDPTLFSDPDRFDRLRERAGVQTFGRGRHSCIGAPLGRELILTAVVALCQYRPRIMDPDRTISYQRRLGHRWPKALRLRLDD